MSKNESDLVTSKIIGLNQLQLSDLYYRQVRMKAQAILDCPLLFAQKPRHLYDE